MPRAAEFAPVEEMLLEEGFIRGCIGETRGKISVYLESTYINDLRQFRARFKARLQQLDVGGVIKFSTFKETERAVSCDALPSRDRSDISAIILYLTFTRGRDSKFSAVEATVKRQDRCVSTRLNRSEWSNDCRERPKPRLEVTPRPAATVKPPRRPSRGIIVKPPRRPSRGIMKGTGLLVAGGILGGAGFIGNILRISLTDPDIQLIVPTSVGNFFALEATVLGAGLRGEYDGHHGLKRREKVYIAAGSALVGLGALVTVFGIFWALRSEDKKFIPLAFGETSLITGGGLLAYGVQYPTAGTTRSGRHVALLPRLDRTQFGISFIAAF